MNRDNRRFSKGSEVILSLCLVFALVMQFAVVPAFSALAEEWLLPEHSTTGPEPPPRVAPKPATGVMGGAGVTVAVPAYSWRHGCGPTAVGMVVGYYDIHGYPDLFPGSAATQTSDVDQGIASQRSALDPGHYEDYSQPIDSWPDILPDKSEPPDGDEHIHDCIADFMRTSWSIDKMAYGWSWASNIGPAFVQYVNLRNPAYAPTFQQYYMSDSTLTWSVLVREIDEGRPMVFLVDSVGDGGTDHFVTVVGYDASTRQYGCLDTWHPANTIRWCDFVPMAVGQPWGVWGGWSFSLAAVLYELTMTADPVEGGTAADLTGASPYQEGAEVSVQAIPSKGYVFVGWTATAGEFEDADAELTTLIMPAEPVTVTANFEEAEIVVVTSDLPDGQIGLAYEATLEATGGVPPYTWAKAEGALPHNLELNAQSGVISGTPSEAGTFNFTVQVTDDDDRTATKALSITIHAAAQPDIAVSPASFNVTLPTDTTLDYTLTIGNAGDVDLTCNISAEETTGGAGLVRDGRLFSTAPSGMVLETPLTSRPIQAQHSGQTQGGWQNIMTEDFEGAFPGEWHLSIEEGATDAYWGRCDYNAHIGDYSAFCAKDGTAAVDPPEYYPNSMYAWMIYGPFSLEDATAAELNFWVWMDIEHGYDYFHYWASIDGSAFYGWWWTGDSEGWVSKSFDLADVYTLGNLCGAPQVWIAFAFESDEMIGYPGVFADDVVLRKYVEGGNSPPNQPSNRSPAHQDPGVLVDADLVWTGGDPDPGDAVTYDVYFDTTGAATLVSPGQSATSYHPGGLHHNTTYYWKIVARDSHGLTATGPIWEFTTAEDDPVGFWLDVKPKSGSVAPGGSHNVTVTVNTTGLAPGTYHAQIVISNNDPDENPKIVPVTMHVSDVLTVTATKLADGYEGVIYEAILEARGGTEPYTWAWTVAEGQQFPPGLNLTAETGLISGIPTEAGTFNFTVQVTDAVENTATRDLSIAISSWNPWAYDENSDGVIQKMEALQAVQDYFGGSITKAQVLEVIQLYFAG